MFPLVPGTDADMGIGTSIILIAIGAILRFAVHGHLSAISIGTVGIILIIAGVVGLIISLLYTAFWAERTRPRRDRYIGEPPARY
jgi:hypothetical protein